jgi:hypothetical protein
MHPLAGFVAGRTLWKIFHRVGFLACHHASLRLLPLVLQEAGGDEGALRWVEAAVLAGVNHGQARIRTAPLRLCPF